MRPPADGTDMCAFDGAPRKVIDRDETSVTWKCPYCGQISRETWECQ